VGGRVCAGGVSGGLHLFICGPQEAQDFCSRKQVNFPILLTSALSHCWGPHDFSKIDPPLVWAFPLNTLFQPACESSHFGVFVCSFVFGRYELQEQNFFGRRCSRTEPRRSPSTCATHTHASIWDARLASHTRGVGDVLPSRHAPANVFKRKGPCSLRCIAWAKACPERAKKHAWPNLSGSLLSFGGEGLGIHLAPRIPRRWRMRHSRSQLSRLRTFLRGTLEVFGSWNQNSIGGCVP
jgi:hypothetical protein